jgi:hypothetical protein
VTSRRPAPWQHGAGRDFFCEARVTHESTTLLAFGKLREAPMPGRIKLLLAIHLVLGIAPAAMFLHPGDLRWIPLTWALSGIAVGQLMLVGVWAGLGAATGVQRWLGIAVGTIYLSVWPTIGIAFVAPREEIVATLVLQIGINASLLLLSTGVFLFVCRRWAELLLVRDSALFAEGRYQFSVLQILIAITCLAMLLGLARASTGADPEGMWIVGLMDILVLVAYTVNLALAVWAALTLGRARWRVAVVIAVAVLLGMIISYAALFRLTQQNWWLWLFATQSLALAIPPVIVVLSLLVVRSAGYRLVPKSVAVEGSRRDIDSNQSLDRL